MNYADAVIDVYRLFLNQNRFGMCLCRGTGNRAAHLYGISSTRGVCRRKRNRRDCRSCHAGGRRHSRAGLRRSYWPPWTLPFQNLAQETERNVRPVSSPHLCHLVNRNSYPLLPRQHGFGESRRARSAPATSSRAGYLSPSEAVDAISFDAISLLEVPGSDRGMLLEGNPVEGSDIMYQRGGGIVCH